VKEFWYVPKGDKSRFWENAKQADLFKLAGVGIGGVQEELPKLVDAVLVEVFMQSTQKLCQAKPGSLVFEELCTMAGKLLNQEFASQSHLQSSAIKPKLDVLLTKNRAAIKKIFKKYKISRIRVFGYMINQTARPGSDVDLLVDLDETFSLLDRIALKQELEELLGRRVDLVTPKTLHWYIRDKVLKEAVAL